MELDRVAGLIRRARDVVAFTGAGISAESGIPTFRGEDGLWLKYDPEVFSMSYLLAQPESAWRTYIEVFTRYFMGREPNEAHRALARMEELGHLKGVITQNVDDLHERAGSRNVVKLHGDARYVRCLKCEARFELRNALPSLEDEELRLPPTCPRCDGLLKPDVVLFEEELPKEELELALDFVRNADVLLVIGTSGEVMPASLLPWEAKDAGAVIVEVNTAPSSYTDRITDLFLMGRASEVLSNLVRALEREGEASDG